MCFSNVCPSFYRGTIYIDCDTAFREDLNIDAADFAEILDRSLVKAYNLVASG